MCKVSSEVVFDEEIGNPFAGSGLVIHDAVTTLISEHDEMAASCRDMLQVLTEKHRRVMRFFDLDYSSLKEENAAPKLAAFFWSRQYGRIKELPCQELEPDKARRIGGDAARRLGILRENA